VAQIVLRGLAKTYSGGVRAVRGVDLAVRDGELMVLVGPSGCGKSTVLRMIAGLEEVTEGQVSIDAEVVNDVPSRDRDIAMVFQSLALYPHLSVYDNIAFGLVLRRLPGAEIDRRVRDVAAMLDLTAELRRRPDRLSGGQRQRVAMGRAIVRRPKAFLMDEPLSSLDITLRARMRAEIARIQRDLKVTTVYVTHDQTEALTLADRLAVLREGSILQVGTPVEVYERPTDLFVAGFVGAPAMNLVAAVLEESHGDVWIILGDQRVLAPPGLLTLRPGLRRYLSRPLVVGIRPEDMDDGAHVGGPPDRTLVSVVDLVEVTGADVLVHFPVRTRQVVAGDLGVAPGNAVLVARFTRRTTVFEGQRVEVLVDVTRLHYFDPDSGVAIVGT
jgi:multiple sugar transport system ATP-binding protein